jgi:hypothetical protein
MSTKGLGLSLDISDITQVYTAWLTDRPEVVRKAVRRALRKTAQWIYRQIAREIQQATGINQKALKPRARITIVEKSLYANIWFGLDPIEAHRAGRARQTRRGVSVGRAYRFDSAFLANADFGKSGKAERKVWRRTIRGAGSTEASRRVLRNEELAGRFPLELLKVPVYEAAEQVFARHRNGARKRYQQILQQEINYALNVEPFRARRRR